MSYIKIIFVTLLLNLIINIKAYTVSNLKNKKFIFTETDDTYLYEDTEYLYHLFNLTTIMEKYKQIEYRSFGRTQQDIINENRISNLIEQTISHSIQKRSINILGTIIKFITGTPDHDDLIEIKTHLNEIIENNNQQESNSHFEQLVSKADPQSISTSLVISETFKGIRNPIRNYKFCKDRKLLV